MKFLGLWLALQVSSPISLEEYRERMFAHIAGRHADSISILKSAMLSTPQDSASLAEIYQMAANAFAMVQMRDSCFYYYTLAATIAVDVGQKERGGYFFRHVGEFQAEALRFEAAIKSMTRALSVFQELGNAEEVVNLLVAISQLNLRTGNLTEAAAFAEKAMMESERMNMPRGIAMATLQQARVALRQGFIDKALERTLSARQQFVQLEVFHGQAQAEGLLAEVYLHSGDVQRALEHATRFHQMVLRTGASKDINFSLVLKGEVLLAAGQTDEAVAALMESLERGKRHSFPEMERKANWLLFQIYDAAANDHQALQHLKRYHQLNDSSLSVAQVEIIERMQAEFNLRAKDRELEHLQTTTELQALRIQQSETRLLAIAGGALLVLLLGFSFFRYRLVRQKLAHAREKELLTRARFQQVLDAEEKERTRVARELHDGLGQMLSTVRLFVSDMDSEPDKVKRSLRALDSTIQEVRTISHSMMPIDLLEGGLEPALCKMADTISASGKVQVTVDGAALPELASSESVALYRSIQEVVNNALKYANATEIRLSWEQSPGLLSVRIKDNGQGFNTENIAKSKGIGWSNIFSRMELVGGRVDVQSRPGSGTQVLLEMPLEAGRLSVAM